MLKVDDREVAGTTMERSIPLILESDEDFDIGADIGTPVSNDCHVPFKFTGKLEQADADHWPVEAVARGYQKAGGDQAR